MVKTADGDTPIEEVTEGIYVLAEDPETGEQGYRKVTRTYIHESDFLVHVYVGEERIDTTPEHPFYVEETGFVTAGNLKAGDIIRTSDGRRLPILKAELEELDEPVPVYNFEVEEFHTYYVSVTGVLVHNNCDGKRLKIDEIPLAKPGQDLYVGTYNKSKYWNKKSGLNRTHTPHHVIQDAVSSVSKGKGITINLKKSIHEKTNTYKSIRMGLTNRQHLASDIAELKILLKNEGYDRSVINAQLHELIKQNIALGGFEK